MRPDLPPPGPFQEGPVKDVADILDAFNRRRAQKGWNFNQLDLAVGTDLNLSAMIRRGRANAESLFRLADALGLEIIIAAKGKPKTGRRERMRQIREAAQQSADEPAGGSED